MRILPVITVLMLLGGCAALQQHAVEIEAAGQAVGAAAPIMAPFNPAVAVGLTIVSGILLVIGSNLKKKENEDES